MFESSNRRHFQRGLDCEAARANRRSAQLSLRRQQREAHLQKKFRLCSNRCAQISTNGESFIPCIKDLSKYVANIMQPSDEALQLRGLMSIRILLSAERSPPSSQVTKSGVVPRIIQFLYGECEDESENGIKCKLEAAWIITNIAACTSECVSCVVQHGAIKGLVHLFRNAPDSETASQAIWGLGNIAGEGQLLRDNILSTGLLSDITKVLDDAANLNTEIQENVIWCLNNIFRFTNGLQLSHIKPIVPVITKLVRESKDERVLADCLWALFYLSNQKDSIVQYLCENGAVTICMKLLHQEIGKYEIALSQLQGKHEGSGKTLRFAGKQRGETATKKNMTKEAMLKMNHNIYRPALRMIGSILSCEDSVTQLVLDAGYLDVLEPFMFHFLGALRKEMFWSLSNIMAGSHHQVESVVSRSVLIERIVKAATHEIMGVRKEACWCICNATQDCITAQKKQLAKYGAIEALCSILAPGNVLVDEHITMIIDGLEGFLEVFGSGSYNPYAQKIEECQGLNYLEDRSGDTSINEDTWHRIVELMKKYWGSHENDYVTNNNTNNNTDTFVDTATKQFKFGTQYVEKSVSDENNSNAANDVARFEF